MAMFLKFVQLPVSSWTSTNISSVGIWYYMVDTTTHQLALWVMHVVHRQRDAATLLPLIQQWTKPGTEVWSDEWRVYNSVDTLPTVSSHLTVNHSLLNILSLVYTQST